VEVLRLANGDNAVTLELNAEAAGISTVVSGTGNDFVDVSNYAATGVFIQSGAGNDLLIGGGGNDTLLGTSATAVGNGEIDTLTGGSGNDLFILGNQATPFYNTRSNAGDYALITDFNFGDRLVLNNQLQGSNANSANGYIIGSDIYSVGIVGAYLYLDTSNGGANGGVENSGDNLIAILQGPLGSVLSTADLRDSSIASFV
jgi:Ca2+-binding RTX toxin-like protein